MCDNYVSFYDLNAIIKVAVLNCASSEKGDTTKLIKSSYYLLLIFSCFNNFFYQNYSDLLLLMKITICKIQHFFLNFKLLNFYSKEQGINEKPSWFM